MVLSLSLQVLFYDFPLLSKGSQFLLQFLFASLVRKEPKGSAGIGPLAEGIE